MFKKWLWSLQEQDLLSIQNWLILRNDLVHWWIAESFSVISQSLTLLIKLYLLFFIKYAKMQYNFHLCPKSFIFETILSCFNYCSLLVVWTCRSHCKSHLENFWLLLNISGEILKLSSAEDKNTQFDEKKQNSII